MIFKFFAQFKSDYRGLGIATTIVQFLLNTQAAVSNKAIYCIPFSKLNKFYQHFGFTECPKDLLIPESIQNKFLWYKKKFSESVDLLFLNRVED